MTRNLLERLYIQERKSSAEIARTLNCSESKVNYWIRKHGIQKRPISEAVYAKRNPQGDPFFARTPSNPEEYFLLGLGVGLYWGEGNKKNFSAVRLGNTDPDLMRAFIRFLEKIYSVRKEKFRFGLQIFSDMKPKDALRFWTNALKISSSQFGKVIVTPARGVGNYREKTKHGVLTVYVSNVKLRKLLGNEIEKLRRIR